MEEIILSVVMITYNQENYVEKAIKSILKQKIDFKYEILIGDDCSKDNTRRILKKYQEEYPDIIKIYFREKNLGANKNIYDLLKKSKGEFIALLEGDDYWIDDLKLKSQLEILSKGKYIATTHANIVVDAEDNFLYNSISSTNDKVFKMNDLIEKGGIFHTATLMFKNIFLENTEKYKILYEAHESIGDFTIYCLLFNQGKIYYQSKLMSAYRHNLPTSDSISVKIRQDYIGNYIKILKLYDNLNNYFENKYNFDNIKVLRTVEVLKVYFLRKPFNYSELRQYLNKLNLKIKLKAFCRFTCEFLKYLKNKKFGSRV